MEPESQIKKSLPYGRQSINADDCAAVLRALQSGFLTGGAEIEAFETEFASMIGASHAVAVSSATAALHLAMRVAGIGRGDRVVTSPNTFLSSANCAAFVGAQPDFTDIDPTTYTLCPRAFEEGLGEDCRAVVAVAYAGQSAFMPEIARIAREGNMVVIEDGCHGVGGGFFVDGKIHRIGAHPWADMTTFSFHPVKSMTTGEGGMLVTENESYARMARILRNHGMERCPERFTTFGTAKDPLEDTGPWSYEMQELGYNYRITDLQCALGRSQLSRLSTFIERRREIVGFYNNAFADLTWIQIPQTSQPDDAEHISWHLYTVLIDFDHLGTTRERVMRKLLNSGVGSQVLYIPVYLQPWYRKTFGYVPGKCPRAEAYYRQCLSLPLYPDLEDKDLERVVSAIYALGRSA